MISEDGSAIPLVLVVLVGGLIAMLLALEVGRLGIVHRRVAFAAEAAAETGASVLAEERARDGVIELDPALAVAAARTYVELSLSGLDSVTFSATAVEICATASETYAPRLLGFVGATPTVITQTSCAVPAAG